MTGSDERHAVVDPDPGHPLGGQDGAAGALPIDLRHAKGRVVREVLAELGGGGGLEAQIHLDLDRLREGFDDLDRLQSAQSRPGALDQTGEPAEQIEVAGKGAGDPGTQDLDRDLAPVGRHRKMDLRDRGCGDRSFVETSRTGCRVAPQTPLRSAPAPQPRERAAGDPAGARDPRRYPRPTDRRGSKAAGRA